MLRIAVPNKGSLSEPAVEMLREAGYRQRRDPRELVLADPDNDAEFFFLRPRDIAVYVGSGTVDVGVTGRDLLLDSGADAVEHMQLGFGGSTFRYAAPAGTITSLEQVQGLRVATSYEVLVEGHLRAHGVDAKVVHLDGAVESAVQLGVADVVADVVSTGTTLRGAGLEVFGDPILVSEAVLIRPRKVAEADVPAGVEVLSRRLQGVLTAHEYVLMDYDVPVSLVDRAVAITPGLESPTVSPLHDRDWAAVRAMVRRDRTNQVMDALYDVGARAILVTRIHASRL
ncbi:ATP phosphoribosyltransferase [Cellulosimicrobium sp. TH-20]|uniref:ATP phosphoribosyltransferase n=1 Tax=Cellulosimicrobium sp. TH-20 TaxID=1980001 RepID=UPI00119EFDA8|nr:ATP phosphoribosyltransferase [Cellulosimicrobium sp. TH-20]